MGLSPEPAFNSYTEGSKTTNPGLAKQQKAVSNLDVCILHLLNLGNQFVFDKLS
jgi:hypothetical protein